MKKLFSLDNQFSRRFWLFAFFACFFGELWMISWSLHNTMRHLLNPICWLIGGIGSSVIGAWLAGSAPNLFLGKKDDFNKKSSFFYPVSVWLVFILGTILAVFYLQKVYLEYPEFSDLSDILPAKREYIRRFLAGEIVYRPVPFSTYDLAATYLPTRWLPFVFADLGRFDYRHISFLGLLVGLFFWVNSFYRNTQMPYPERFFKTAIPFLLVAVLAVNDPASLGLGVELLMVGYYLILAKNLMPREPFALAFCLLLCLLSRYSLVVWCPFLAFVLFFEKGWKYVAAVSFWVILGVFCLYLIPFCRHDMGKNFIEAYDYYIWGCFETWKIAPWQAAGDIPFNHSRGIGFSFFFYKFAPGTLQEKYDFMLRAGTYLSLAVTAASILFYWKKMRGKSLATVELFLMASLKIFMVVFTGFLVLPFSYLFAIPLFLTLPLLFRIPIARLWG